MNSEYRIEPGANGALRVSLAGNWTIAERIPSADSVAKEIAAKPGATGVCFNAEGLQKWDSGLLNFLARLEKACSLAQIPVIRDDLPQGVRSLLALAAAVPERKDAQRGPRADSFFYKVGEDCLAFFSSTAELLTFIGEVILAFFNLLRGKARFRFRDLALNLQECGAQALPVVTLISVLIGLILAFIGALQLKMFGAQIYVADLVTIGMAREMGAMMPGIIMAGRTGASFAAQLGTMQVNEEIDALKTLGIAPMEFLVLPRTLAMALMMPLLCIYGNLLGIMGGALVSISMFGLTPAEYFHETAASAGYVDFAIGIFKSGVFGVLVAVSGCLRGIQCGRSSAAVGAAATSAVVTGIVSIIVADSLITVITSVLNW